MKEFLWKLFIGLVYLCVIIVVAFLFTDLVRICKEQPLTIISFGVILIFGVLFIKLP